MPLEAVLALLPIEEDISSLLQADSHIKLQENVKADFSEFIDANTDSAVRLQRAATVYDVLPVPERPSSLLSQLGDAKQEVAGA
ncbi:MAG: hypothetical protein LBU32_03555 [Clostridiales bacterium]|nr:hypothetical protein [Clostridiales bacterium]